MVVSRAACVNIHVSGRKFSGDRGRWYRVNRRNLMFGFRAPTFGQSDKPGLCRPYFETEADLANSVAFGALGAREVAWMRIFMCEKREDKTLIHIIGGYGHPLHKQQWTAIRRR